MTKKKSTLNQIPSQAHPERLSHHMTQAGSLAVHKTSQSFLTAVFGCYLQIWFQALLKCSPRGLPRLPTPFLESSSDSVCQTALLSKTSYRWEGHSLFAPYWRNCLFISSLHQSTQVLIFKGQQKSLKHTSFFFFHMVKMTPYLSRKAKVLKSTFQKSWYLF